MKTILITGSSGFVGSSLSKLFLLKGFHVIGIGTSENHPLSSQYPEFQWVRADTTVKGHWQNKVSCADFIINLAGRSIFHYWTKNYKQTIYDSRILTTRNLIDAMEKGKTQKFLSTSAVGIYGDCKEELITEDKQPGKGFLAEVCVNWEKEAFKAKEKGVSVAIMRFGVVLGNGGALSLMIPAFKILLGGSLGNGQQWFPWIHIKDLGRAVKFLIDNKSIEGKFNFTGPELIRQRDFSRALGQALQRPAIIPLPAFVIKTIMGELGRSLLESQKANPKYLVSAGYDFKFRDIDSTLTDILRK